MLEGHPESWLGLWVSGQLMGSSEVTRQRRKLFAQGSKLGMSLTLSLFASRVGRGTQRRAGVIRTRGDSRWDGSGCPASPRVRLFTSTFG